MSKTTVGVHINVLRDVLESLKYSIENAGGNPDLVNSVYDLDAQINALGLKGTVKRTIDAETVEETPKDEIFQFHLDNIHNIYVNGVKETNINCAKLVSELTKLGYDVVIYGTQKAPFVIPALIWLSNTLRNYPSMFNSLNIQLGVDDPSRLYDMVISDNPEHLDEGASDILVTTSEGNNESFATAPDLEGILQILNK